MRKPMNKWALLALVFGGVVLADQTGKFLAVDKLTTVFASRDAATFGAKLRGFYTFEDLEPYRTAPVPVVQRFWHMKYVENPGAAWGLFQGMPEGARNWFFIVVSLGASAFILYYYRKLTSEQRHLMVSLALVLGGAVGNFADRLARHYVIDFIDWHWLDNPALHWPTFNIADSAIVVGVAMMVLDPGKRKKAVPASAPPPSSPPGEPPAGNNLPASEL